MVEAGPWAIEAYVEEPLETRFIQSFKKSWRAASPLFKHTQILGKWFRFEDLLSTFLLKMRGHAGGCARCAADHRHRRPPGRLRRGQPRSRSRPRKGYETAIRRLGFTDLHYAYEPVAAAFFFGRQLTHDATVLVGDFGGGTSDFSLVRFERRGGAFAAVPLANAGVGVAGDAFDYRIIDNLVSLMLGRGSSYKAFDNILPIPARYFTAFAKWEQLALLARLARHARYPRLVRTSLQPEKIERLVEMLDDNHGYRLYQAVSRLKEALSAEEAATFRFDAGSIHIEREVSRVRFEGWIAPELAAIEAAADQAIGLRRPLAREGPSTRSF